MAPRRVLTDSPFDTLEKTFDLLVTGPNPFALDGTWLDGLPDQAIPLGAALMAAEAGVVLADLSWRRKPRPRPRRQPTPRGSRRSQRVLLLPVRLRSHPPGCWLDQWWSERRCAREWGEVVRPDGYGIWTETDTSLPFLLEYDNGSKHLERLAGTGHVRGVDVRGFAPLTEHDDLGVLSDSDRRHETTGPRSRHKPR